MISYEFLPKGTLVEWINDLLYDPKQYLSKITIEFCTVRLISDEIININIYEYSSSHIILDFMRKNDPYNNDNLIKVPKNNLKSRFLFENEVLYLARSLNTNPEQMGPNIYCFNNIEENVYNKLLLKLTI